MGPISKCDALVKPSCTYFIQNIVGVNVYNWSCVGGTCTPSSNTTSAEVVWDPLWTGTYSIAVSFGTACESVLYLQSCACEIQGVHEAIDINERDFSTIQLLAKAIYPDPLHYSIPPSLDRIYFTGATIFIRGELNIFLTPVYFINCTLIMDIGSIIYTPPAGGLNLGQIYTNTHIYGACNNMWKGIVIGPEGLLTLEQNSSLQDAEYGITINSKMTLNLSDSKFSRNYVCIYGPPTIHINHFIGSLNNNEFDGSLPLVSGRFIGQNFHGQIANIGGTYPAPQNNLSFGGFEFHELDPTSSPYAIPFSQISGDGNWFHDFNVGIYGYHSQLDVLNCRFDNITRSAAYQFYGDYIGSAVYAETPISLSQNNITIGGTNNGNIIQANSFSNCFRSVLLKGNLNSVINGNDITNNNFIAIEVKESINRTHSIINNIINPTGYGIFSNLNQQSSMDIQNNNITTVDDGRSYRWGININDLGISCSAHVINNVILSYSTLGILSRNNSGSFYTNNAITLDHFNLPSLTKDLYGFAMENGIGNTIDCNSSTGPSYYANNFFGKRMRSFYLNSSTDNIVSCNYAHESRYGFEFVGNCLTTEFYGNKMLNLYDGLLLGDYANHITSDIGIQGIVTGTNNSPGNYFYGRDAAGNFWHAATMTINSSPQTGSLWVNSGIYQPLTNYNSGGGNPFQPFIASGFDPYFCINCSNSGGGGTSNFLINNENIVLNSEVGYSIDEEIIQWDKEKRLYEKLRFDSSLVDSSIVLENFMDSTQYNNKGKFGEITNDLKNIAKERELGSPEALIQSLIDNSDIRNSNIIPEADYEAVQKTINEIILNKVLRNDYEFTTSQINSIMSIANSCPYIKGTAVFQARSLANYLNGELFFDDVQLCSNLSSYRIGKPVNTSKDASVYISPNPVSDLLTINFLNDIESNGTLSIINSRGEIVSSQKIDSNTNQQKIDTHPLQNGIYVIRINNKDINKVIGKVSIIH